MRRGTQEIGRRQDPGWIVGSVTAIDGVCS